MSDSIKLLELEYRSLPAFISKVIRPDFDPAPYYIKFHNTYELSLEKLEKVDPEFASQLQNYWLSVRAFLDNLARGIQPSEYLTTLRSLTLRTQVTSKGSKSDLIKELSALEKLEAIAPLLEHILAQAPDGAVENPLVKTEQIDSDCYLYTFTLPGQNNYPTILGGLASRAEIARVFILKVSYAKWRDRRVRKIISLEVLAKEIWPKK